MIVEVFHLLKDRIRHARGKRIPWQEEHRQAVHMRYCGCRDHVRRAWARRCGAGHYLLTIECFGISNGGMGHALLIVRAIGWQILARLIQRLA